MLSRLPFDDCLESRAAQARLHIGRDEWASALIHVLRLRDCARHTGCGHQAECGRVVEELMADIRVLVD